MKAVRNISLVLISAVLATACSKEVQVEALPGFDPNSIIPSQIPEGRVGVYSQAFQNPYGTIEFQQNDATTVQTLRTCTASIQMCDAMNLDPSTDFTLKLNDANSIYTHTFQGNTWNTHVSGNSNSLHFNSQVLDPSGAQIKVVDELFQVSDDPCGYGAGRGLEVKQHVSEGTSAAGMTTDSCQAYF